MLIDIEENIFNQLKSLMKNRNTTLYTYLNTLQPIQDSLTTARTIKTDRIKDNIKSILRELVQSNIKPTKYKVHKSTNIAYVTINKYYDEILDEVLNER